MQLLTEIQAECCEPLILNILALNLEIVLLLNQFFGLNLKVDIFAQQWPS